MRMLVLAALLAAPARAELASYLIRLGLRDAEPTQWTGGVALDAGAVARTEPWLCDAEDTVEPTGAFRLRTDARPGNPPVQPNGLLLEIDAPATAELTLRANGAEGRVRLGAVDWGRPATLLDGAASIERAPLYTLLRDGPGEDDHPAAGALEDGSLVAVWQSWSEADGRDQLYLARGADDGWQSAVAVPGAAGDLWRPAVADDGGGACLLVWSQLTDGDYDLWWCRAANGAFTPPQRLAERAGHDVDVALARAGEGTIHAVWRGQGEGSFDILRATLRDGVWSAPAVLDGSPANAWSPAVAAGPGGVWAAWDSYEFGSYDVFAARLDETPTRRVTVAAGPRFEAKARVACAGDGGVWFAWQEAGEAWGKDTGYTVPTERRREPIYRERTVRLACLRGGQWFGVPAPEAGLPEGQRGQLEEPTLTVDGRGRVWLAYRRPLTYPRQAANQVRGERVWENQVLSLEGDAWSPPRSCVNRMARQDSRLGLVPRAQGAVLVFHTDGRSKPDLRRMEKNRVFATSFVAAGAPPEPALEPRLPVEPRPIIDGEAAAVARCREAVLEAGGRRWFLVRGDLHRHTEVSWDGTGDGGLLDCYRYAMDAASLDFLMVADHNQRSGVDLPYIRWWSYKVAEVMHQPGVFTPFFGYERSLGYPNGHRNVVQTETTHESFRMAGAADDLDQLYAYARRTRSIVIPHTTGTGHGTNWPFFDARVEPVIEIFQGCRLSYEYEGCPKGGAPGDEQAERTGYQPQGFLWRAWERDLRLGITASSDHGSTHYSYSGVWTPERSRAAILESLRARRTFGATDNLIVRLRCGDRVLGEAWPQDAPPTLDIRVDGTSELTRVDLIRDRQFVYTADPEGSTFELSWQEAQPTPGTHQYYVRAIQADESIAWGSPVWIAPP